MKQQQFYKFKIYSNNDFKYFKPEQNYVYFLILKMKLPMKVTMIVYNMLKEKKLKLTIFQKKKIEKTKSKLLITIKTV